jgi:hypothetical protein
MRDEIVVASLVIAFATLVTTHVMLVVGLLGRRPRWRSPVALLVPPLAPYWGYQLGMKKRSIAWVSSALAYAVLRWLASH